MIGNFCPSNKAKKSINLKFAWKFMKKVFGDYVILKKEL